MAEELKILDEGDSNLRVRATVLRTDTKSRITGVVYPRDVMEKAIRNYKDKYKDRMGRLGFIFESGSSKSAERPSELSKATHIIEDISINDVGEVVVELSVMENTRPGKILASLLRSGCSFNSSIHGHGTVDEETKTVKDYDLGGVDLCVRPGEKAILDHSHKMDDFELSELKRTGKGHRRVLRIER